jgi:hypothetical protein
MSDGSQGGMPENTSAGKPLLFFNGCSRTLMSKINLALLHADALPRLSTFQGVSAHIQAAWYPTEVAIAGADYASSTTRAG